MRKMDQKYAKKHVKYSMKPYMKVANIRFHGNVEHEFTIHWCYLIFP